MTRPVGFTSTAIIPISGDFRNTSFYWNDLYIPVGKGLLAFERTAYEAALLGATSIYVVVNNKQYIPIRNRLGNWMYSPAFARKYLYHKNLLEEGKGHAFPNLNSLRKRIPIFYIISDFEEEGVNTLLWSTLKAMILTTKMFETISAYALPDKYLVMFPYSATDLDFLNEVRKTAMSWEGGNIFFERDGKTILDGELCPFIIRYNRFVEFVKAYYSSVNKKKKEYESLEKALKENFYKKIQFKEVFENIARQEDDIFLTPTWSYDITLWEGYRSFLLETKEFPEREEFLSKKEFIPRQTLQAMEFLGKK